MNRPVKDNRGSLDYETPTPPEGPPRRPRVVPVVLIVGAIGLTAYGVSTGNGSVAMNFGTMAFGLVLVAVFVRYGNPRL